ncbi:Probable homogentisate phytyltransferase 2, chloroplastic [Galdieria sulphuraria]|nr:Probable homogentisate phytyltransferase 2, chloroplastic [Galdieria sulphuraria]
MLLVRQSLLQRWSCIGFSSATYTLIYKKSCRNVLLKHHCWKCPAVHSSIAFRKNRVRMSKGRGTGTSRQWKRSLEAISKFSRPHTVRGTLLAAISGCLRAILEGGFFVSKSLLFRALLGVIALILGNIFIVGINQIYDIDVDKVNKPFLPLAAREMELSLAWLVVVISGICGVAITRVCFSRLIFYLYISGLSFGALYSLPPFRLRRWPWMAAITISFVRGFLLNFGVYHATKAALGLRFQWNPTIVFTACFMTIYACVIALAKDLPDVQGDKQYRVETFAAKMGVEKVVKMVTMLLLSNYIFAIVVGLVAPYGTFSRKTMLLTHSCLALLWIRESKRLQPNNKQSLIAFYRSIWNLFYAEYCILPFL